MSRMTKFLRQSCAVEAYQVDSSGQPKHNQFGEILYEEPVTCRCRHEIAFQDVQVTNGSIVKSASRYYLDGSLEIKADYRIDGRAVLTVTSYVNQLGQVEGYEVYV